MKNKKNDVDLITADANQLSNAIKALETYIYCQFNSSDITVEDINKINGLIASIKLLAEKHADEMVDFSIGGN
ncbi:hypothetical protein DOK76_03795 [Vagococcus sp. DIV0080]|uniref:Uncharacterized protein n=1 Tax=Candidatus Vagococcus giribetii TaxID=2230876 RepID=A0ABS3HSP0_9ENTE|nr:hypothetical protein [Vagococcus sp. DIV0080]MBO0476178.1 hypothetical protein [Vagococcus sp. DIV0080]